MKRTVSLVGLGVLTCLFGACEHARADGCERAGVLFAFRGSLEEWQRGTSPTLIADSFVAPHNTTWAPGCAGYAFIDAGSLWVGRTGYPPRRAAVAGQILDFHWRPDGQSVAVTADSRACSNRRESAVRRNHGDAFVVAAQDLSSRRLTNDCRSYVLGWSSDGRTLLLVKEASFACDAKSALCPGWDLSTLDLESNLQVRVISEQSFARTGYSSEPEFIHWNARESAAVIWTMILQIGGLGEVAAVQVPSGRVLWSYEAYRAAPLGGGGLVSIVDRMPEDYDATGHNWSLQQGLLSEGTILAEFPPVTSNLWEAVGPLSLDGKYALWFEPGYLDDIWHVNFATPTEPKAWSFELPRGHWLIESLWTPWGDVVLETYACAKKDEDVLQLWCVDRRSRAREVFFSGTLPVPPGADAHAIAEGGRSFLPNGKVIEFDQPLALARWPQ